MSSATVVAILFPFHNDARWQYEVESPMFPIDFARRKSRTALCISLSSAVRPSRDVAPGTAAHRSNGPRSCDCSLSPTCIDARVSCSRFA
jgi:hypothetical protein